MAHAPKRRQAREGQVPEMLGGAPVHQPTALAPPQERGGLRHPLVDGVVRGTGTGAEGEEVALGQVRGMTPPRVREQPGQGGAVVTGGLRVRVAGAELVEDRREVGGPRSRNLRRRQASGEATGASAGRPFIQPAGRAWNGPGSPPVSNSRSPGVPTGMSPVTGCSRTDDRPRRPSVPSTRPTSR